MSKICALASIQDHVPSGGVRASPSLIDQAAPPGRIIMPPCGADVGGKSGQIAAGGLPLVVPLGEDRADEPPDRRAGKRLLVDRPHHGRQPRLCTPRDSGEQVGS